MMISMSSFLGRRNLEFRAQSAVSIINVFTIVEQQTHRCARKMTASFHVMDYEMLMCIPVVNAQTERDTRIESLILRSIVSVHELSPENCNSVPLSTALTFRFPSHGEINRAPGSVVRIDRHSMMPI